MDIVCRYLHTYYDTNILEHNPKFRDIFLDILKKAKTTKYTNNTLLKLITNISIPKEIVPYINGPFTLSLHTSKEYNMNVYVFGEHHSEATSNENIISEYLYKFMKTSNVFIDFFFEYFKLRGDKKFKSVRNDSYLNLLRHKFDPCIRKHSSCLSLNSSRTHYLDIRDLDNSRNPILRYIEMVNNFHNNNAVFGKTDKDYKFIYSIMGINKNNIKDFIKNNYIEASRLDKELYKTDKYMRKVIENFIQQKIDSHPDFEQPDKKDLDDIFGRSIKELQDKTNIYSKFTHISNLLINTGSLLTDAYTLARLFKTFNIKDGDNQPKKVHNAIMYAGDYHSSNYREIFDILNFDVVFNIKEPYGTSRLNISEIYQPLFSVNSGVITNFYEK